MASGDNDQPSGSGNGSASALDVRAVRAALPFTHGKRKLDLLLAPDDPAPLIQAIPEQELYLAVLEIGAEDAAEVIALASPAQFNHFVDVACWPKRDAGPDPRKVLNWLQLARAGTELSDEARVRNRERIASMDSELLALVLRRELRVHELVEGEDPPVAEENWGSTFRTPEGRYLVEFVDSTSGSSSFSTLKDLLDDLYAEDVLGTTRMLESLRWEVPTELEEVARRWREGRLRDLGVPDLDEALAFYARPPRTTKKPAAAAASGGAAAATAALLVPNPVPLLERAMERLTAEERDRAEESVVYAANAALVAGSVQPDDPVAVRAALADARATLSLGLDLLSAGDEEAAARALADRAVRAIFQVGMGERYRLQARARAALQSARLPQAQSASLFDPPLSSVLETLASTRPALADLLGKREPIPPASRAELLVADALLDEAEATVLLLSALGLSSALLGPLAESAGIGPSALRASDAVRAKVLCDLRGQPFSLADLPEPGSPLPEGFVQKLDSMLASGVATLHSGPALRAAARLRTHVL